MVTVFVGCEYSGTVGKAFQDLGHEVLTCDLEPADRADVPHHQGDLREVLANPRRFFESRIELMIVHPECTYLTSAGAKHLYMLDERGVSTLKDANGDLIPNLERRRNRDEAVEFVRYLMDADVPRIALENPQGMLSSLYRKPDQYIEPWMFGHPETKKTGLWLKNLPPLVETQNVHAEMLKLPPKLRNRIHRMSPGPNRWKARSTTYTGIAEAMAAQWAGDATKGTTMTRQRAGRPGLTPAQRAWHDEPSTSVDTLRSLTQQRNDADGQIAALVAKMRNQECPWSVIGDALGMTKQAAQQRYGKKPTGPDPDRETTLPGL